ncbi:hypothetical protein N7471_010021 [Penicillium samsonianum]|uniref:uncharacterized protein n=1 Tax=Penicillium samsonianum TaxID=1882272 RepID=UPI002546FE9F|nr:uncharacterized protein N7471_010021 [Penicillium samsonianum]KAJ6128804.1 hypothetical protein N7471_010021 [Penicillium samsonianum]
MTDYSEIHHDDSESLDSKDLADSIDAEDETVFENDPDDDDAELNTLGCVPDSEDHVESELEVEYDEGDDDEEDDEDVDDGNKLNISRPTIGGPFSPTNPPPTLTSLRMPALRDDTDWEETMSPETWVYRGFKQSIGRSSAEKIIQIFKEVIPASTRAILVRSTLTHEDIIALPNVDHSLTRPGIYLICLAQSNDQQPQVPDEDLIDSTTDQHPRVPDEDSTDSATDQQGEVPSGLYTGSSIKNVSGRCVDHSAKFKQIARTILRDDRLLPNGNIAMYLYCYAKKYGLVPSYRQIAIFPEQLEGIDFPHADTRWLVRLLEQVVTLLLDTYAPSQTSQARRRYGYTDEMYLGALAQCEIPPSMFHPLNHAMPLKQKCGWTVGARVCQNCGSQSTAANGWYYDPAACEVAVLYNCSACYWYRFRNDTNRPPDFFVALKGRPKAGPCSNCEATESTQWEWHPRDKNRVICSKCRSHWTRYAIDRPPKQKSTVQTVVPQKAKDIFIAPMIQMERRTSNTGVPLVPCVGRGDATAKPGKINMQT